MICVYSDYNCVKGKNCRFAKASAFITLSVILILQMHHGEQRSNRREAGDAENC